MRFSCLRLAVLCLVIAASVADEIDSYWNEYIALIETLDKYGYGELSPIDKLHQNSSHTIDAKFDCRPSVSPERPTSVNKLRPGDISVIGSLGDSLTAANGAGAVTLIGVAIEYRGLSAPIGGDKDFASVVTLSNIIRKYNPEIYGFSTGTGGVDNPRSRLNVAVPGAVSEGMPGQARNLVERMRDHPNVDFKNDWKLVTLFIGGNDLCRQCKDPERLSPANYVAHVEEAVGILAEVPRMFVNVIGILEAWRVAELTGIVCDILHLALCPCGMNERDKEIMKEATTEYQTLLQESINSGKFDRDDFAAVFQPFFMDTLLPRHLDGEPDYSYFAPDCFHFSEKAHAAQAVATWNNMLQPVGSKDKSWDPDSDIRCPSEDFPYLYTNVNSKESWADPNNQEHDQGYHQQDEQQHDGSSAPEDGLSSGVVVVIVVSVLALLGGLAFLVYRHTKKSKRFYVQLQ